MRTFDLKKIKEAVAGSIEIRENGYTWIKYFPLQLCLACGWDKFDYDKYQIKYCAGALQGEELECFETLYLGIQNVLAVMESMSCKVNEQGKPIINTTAVRNTIELWNNVSFQKTKGTVIEQIDKQKRMKDIRDAEEVSPIKV